MLSFRYKISLGVVSTEDTLERILGLRLCQTCNCSSCIKKSTVEIIDEIDKQNEKQDNKFRYIEIVDFMLSKKYLRYKNLPNKNFFNNTDLIDLMYVQAILEANLIDISSKKDNIVEADYLDLTYKVSSEYYINILYRFYKTKDMAKHLVIDLNNIEKIFDEKDPFLKIYKIAAFYKYLIEYEKIDILKALRRNFTT